MDDIDALFTKPVVSHQAMTEEEIVSAIAGIDPAAVAAEVGQWLLDNVENYVDNHRTVYRLYLTVGASNTMTSMGALQNLYMSTPAPSGEDDKEAIASEGRCLDLLDDFTTRVKTAMFSDSVTLRNLYERLVYYYEMTGFSNQSGPVIQQFDGHIEMLEFIYEPLSMEVVVSCGEEIVDASGNPLGQSKPKEVVKREMMPEGFAVEFELKYWKRPSQELY